MSMLDSFFNKGFKAAKCKTLLKLTIPRIKLLRNRREIQLKQMRRDIAKLLETGQEATARIRVEHIIREEKMMAAQEILELFCELISVRLPIIEAQRECPLDLKEAISSVCFAAPRCADLPELQQVQMMFVGKYGREFVAAASELMPDCGVNRQIIELLSIRAPPAADKLKLLKEIAEEHELEWDPAASEAELFKSHEDLLNGSTEFMSGAKLPLPKEKHDESLYSAPEQPNHEKEDKEEDEDDSLDFPEVPKATVIRASAPLQMFPLSPQSFQNHPQDSEFPEIKETLTRSGPEEEEEEERTVDTTKQFLPFISPPSFPSSSFSVREEPKETPPEGPALSRTRSEASIDLQDVITAAKAAAESAERAAAAARSAASLAQLRINELNLKKDTSVPSPVPDTSFEDNPFGTETVVHESPSDSPMVHRDICESEVPEHSPTDRLKFDDDSPSPPKHQPERSPSMDDDPYSTYPSLFSSQNSTNGTNSHLFNEARFDRDP